MFNGKSILVVDDEPDLREILSDEFQMLGAKVDTAPNGKTAWEKSKLEKFDLVISDLRMPGGDGVVLSKALKRDALNSPILILMTGFADLTAEEAFAIGAEGFMTKPFLLDTFRENLQRLMTEPRARWAQSPGPTVASVQIDDAVFAGRARATYLGRGGMFLPVKDLHVRVGQEIAFRAAGFAGTAIVRWVRSNTSAIEEAGLGIEFLTLAPAHLEAVLQAIAQDRPQAYIPRGQ